MKLKNILFITCDGPHTSYTEGLFMPILNTLQAKGNFEIHVVQQIASKLEILCYNQEMLKSFVEKGYDKVLANYTEDRYVQKVQILHESFELKINL